MAPASGLTAVLVVALFCQAMALKCYQAPKSWEPCWRDPNGLHHGHDNSFRGDSRFQMDYKPESDDNNGNRQLATRTFATRKTCTIPCGGVGMLPRELLGSYEIKTACSSCTGCFQWGGGEGNGMIDEKKNCEAVGCCDWESGYMWGGYCNAAKTDQCSRSSLLDSDTFLTTSELTGGPHVSCKDLPSFGVSPWEATAEEAGFELRECEDPSHVCASYCVSVHEMIPDQEGYFWGSYDTSRGGDQVSCSHGCLPKEVKTNHVYLKKSAEELLEDIFKTSLALESLYWCPSGSELPDGVRMKCAIPKFSDIYKREGSDDLYTGKPMVTGGKGLCDNNVEKNDHWSCKFRVCTTDGCNFSAASALVAWRAWAAVFAAVLALALVGI